MNYAGISIASQETWEQSRHATSPTQGRVSSHRDYFDNRPAEPQPQQQQEQHLSPSEHERLRKRKEQEEYRQLLLQQQADKQRLQPPPHPDDEPSAHRARLNRKIQQQQVSYFLLSSSYLTYQPIFLFICLSKNIYLSIYISISFELFWSSLSSTRQQQQQQQSDQPQHSDLAYRGVGSAGLSTSQNHPSASSLSPPGRQMPDAYQSPARQQQQQQQLRVNPYAPETGSGAGGNSLQIDFSLFLIHVFDCLLSSNSFVIKRLCLLGCCILGGVNTSPDLKAARQRLISDVYGSAGMSLHGGGGAGYSDNNRITPSRGTTRERERER